MNIRTLSLSLALTTVLSGCVSQGLLHEGLSSELIAQRTSFALGLTQDKFSISNRVDDGVRTDYNVETKSGKKYLCFMLSVPAVSGRVAMEATCNELKN